MTVFIPTGLAKDREAPQADAEIADEAPWLSVVLPAHNEAEHIVAVVAGFAEAARQVSERFEVVVVDDGSRDGTAGALEGSGLLEDPRVRLVRRARCGGYGKALTTGFEAAQGEWVFFSDSDGQFDPSELPGFLAPIEGGELDMVLGYRSPRQDPGGRKVLGRLWTGLVTTTLRLSVRDVNCAFKAIHRRHLNAMELSAEGAMINAELLHKARRMGLTAVERPVTHLARTCGEQSGARLDVIGRALRELLRYRVRSGIERWRPT